MLATLSASRLGAGAGAGAALLHLTSLESFRPSDFRTIILAQHPPPITRIARPTSRFENMCYLLPRGAMIYHALSCYATLPTMLCDVVGSRIECHRLSSTIISHRSTHYYVVFAAVVLVCSLKLSRAWWLAAPQPVQRPSWNRRLCRWGGCKVSNARVLKARCWWLLKTYSQQ